jgi:hypothetical protein
MLNKRILGSEFTYRRAEVDILELSGAKYFTTLDLALGVHQWEMDEKSKEFTAFRPRFGGLYEFNRVPDGLK